MPLLTTRLPNLRINGPIIEVLVSPSQSLRKILQEKGETVPQPIKKTMLIDTGASASAIKTGVSRELNLTPHGTITISTASHKSVICATFDIDLIFTATRVVVSNVRVFESGFEGQPIDGLIGRDILNQGLLIYSGYDNSFILGF